MKTPAGKIDIFLQPGDFYFGDSSIRIRTLLGSCVSVTMWHPVRRIGGMCHIMLPSRAKRLGVLQGQYADEALELLLRAALQERTKPNDYQFKIFGGGTMFPVQENRYQARVAPKNVEAVRLLLERRSMPIISEHVGLSGHRNIIFEIWSGHVWVRHQSMA